MILEAFPPVTVPSSLNIVFNVLNFSTLLFPRIPSSAVINWPSLSVKGTISLSNLPELEACAALCCESFANSSCCARVTLYFSAIFSAVTPIGTFRNASVKPSCIKLSTGATSSLSSILGALVILSMPPTATTFASPN